MITLPAPLLQDVGCIVARFQVDELHEAHKQLVDFVASRHEKVIILLGVSPLPNTRNNPLPFEARRQMLLEDFPNVTVSFVKNHISDEIWSKNLDQVIQDHLTLAQTAVLYGSRDSFISHYKGVLPTLELETDLYVSGSEVRTKISKGATFNKDWRRGAIWAAYNRYPTSYQAVDAVIFNEDKSKILLVRKPGEDKFRFCGGFVDPKTKSLEENCSREVMEELHIEVSKPKYIGSSNINDWRYRGEVDGVMTTLFACTHISGTPTPDDDICEAKWFVLDLLTVDELMPAHHCLLDLLWENITNVRTS